MYCYRCSGHKRWLISVMGPREDSPMTAELYSDGQLCIDRLNPIPLPLGRDADIDPEAPCPPALDGWMFGTRPFLKSEALCVADSICHSYAIIDANRVQGCVEMIESSELERACLYDGEMAVELRDMAPWLVRLDPGNSFVRKLFSTTPEDTEPPTWMMWSTAPAIYIRSRLDLHGLRTHLRHFTRIELEDGAESFLRFWDPLCFEDMMTAYAGGGMQGLFTGINSFVVYHSRAALCMTCDYKVQRVPVRINSEHRRHYRDLRRVRLADAITDHFLTLPEFCKEERSAMHLRVEKYLVQARRIGLREAADLHQLALGLALTHRDIDFQKNLKIIYDDDSRDMSQRRSDIIARITTRIDEVKDGHAGAAS